MNTKMMHCDRCGNVPSNRPSRLTIYKPETKTFKDCFGVAHTHKLYSTHKTLHLCDDCLKLFNSFMDECKYHNDVTTMHVAVASLNKEVN